MKICNKIIICLFLFFYFINIKAESNFISKNENGEYFDNVSFKLTDLNDNSLINIINNKEHLYYFDSSIKLDYNKAYNLLNFSQKNIISNIRTINKENYILKNYSSEKDYIENNNDGIYMIKNDNIYEINILCFLILDKTNIDEMYIKDKVVIPGIIKLKFNSENDGAYEREASLNFLNVYIKYDESIDYFNIEKTLNYIFETKDDNIFYTECGYLPDDYYNLFHISNNDSNSYIESESSCKNIPMIINYKGNTSLSINTLVNNNDETLIDTDSEVLIKVLVMNKGSIDSFNNIIESKINNGLEVVNDSISDNGTYNMKDNSVIWNIDDIKPSEQITLYYKVKPKTQIEENKSYRIGSSVINNIEKVKLSSNKAEIKVNPLINPKTGDDRTYIVIFGLVVSSLLFIALKSKVFINRL